jgi:hypothetical protein
LHLTVRRRQLRGGGRCRQDECRNDCEFLHIGCLRAPALSKPGVLPARTRQQGKPSRSWVCSGTAFVGNSTAKAHPPLGAASRCDPIARSSVTKG